MTLYQVGWSCFGVEAALGLALAVVAALLGLSTWLRFRAGVYAVIVLMVAPVLFFLVGVAKRI